MLDQLTAIFGQAIRVISAPSLGPIKITGLSEVTPSQVYELCKLLPGNWTVKRSGAGLSLLRLKDEPPAYTLAVEQLGAEKDPFFSLVDHRSEAFARWAIQVCNLDTSRTVGGARVIDERSDQLLSRTLESDLAHNNPGDLERAAAAYLLHGVVPEWVVLAVWPWDREAFKPRSFELNLVRGGALAVAALDRLLFQKKGDVKDVEETYREAGRVSKNKLFAIMPPAQVEGTADFKSLSPDEQLVELRALASRITHLGGARNVKTYIKTVFKANKVSEVPEEKRARTYRAFEDILEDLKSEQKHPAGCTCPSCSEVEPKEQHESRMLKNVFFAFTKIKGRIPFKHWLGGRDMDALGPNERAEAWAELNDIGERLRRHQVEDDAQRWHSYDRATKEAKLVAAIRNLDRKQSKAFKKWVDVIFPAVDYGRIPAEALTVIRAKLIELCA